jgi:glutathione-regulated potassium-efflux system ancillary protein KefC
VAALRLSPEVVAAYALGSLATRAKLPPLIGYLAAGFVLAGFGIEGGALLSGIAHYGVILLLFTLGLKIRLRNMMQAEVLGGGLLQLGISILLLTGLFTVSGLAAGIGIGTTSTVLLAILLGVASTVVAAKGLEERNELEAYHGRVAIGILIVEDIILIGVLAFAGLQAPSLWALLLLLVPLLQAAQAGRLC